VISNHSCRHRHAHGSNFSEDEDEHEGENEFYLLDSRLDANGDFKLEEKDIYGRQTY
jgi:hypothetical protein